MTDEDVDGGGGVNFFRVWACSRVKDEARGESYVM